MKDYEIKFAIQRANDLAQELLSREENGLKKADAGLIADACASYGAAILVGEAAQDHLDDLMRRIVGYHASDMADDFRTREIHVAGPTDSEFLARALTFYANNLDKPPAPAQAA